MHPAVETILSRMKSNPEEFNSSGKWMYLLDDYRTHFTKEEDQAIKNGIRELRMGQLQERIFKILTDDTLDQTIEDNSAFGMAPMKMSGQPINYGITTAINGTGSSTILNTGATTASTTLQLTEELRHFRDAQQLALEEMKNDLRSRWNEYKEESKE